MSREHSRGRRQGGRGSRGPPLFQGVEGIVSVGDSSPPVAEYWRDWPHTGHSAVHLPNCCICCSQIGASAQPA